MFDRLDETIVAISSPAGASVRGVIRLSGERAFALADDLFLAADGSRLCDAGGHQRLIGRVCIEDDCLVPAEVYTFRAPSSYTKQDVIELHVPGSPPVLAMLLERFSERGARPAEPGEFTGRAFLLGAMDLTCVEGVAAMIHARNDSQLRASEALLHGQLTRRTAELREQLADLLALVEAEIDFAEEPIDFISPQQLAGTIERILTVLNHLLANAPAVERLELLPQVVLIGRPNAGKSTLFNRLTGIDRAIQSATAGTTRDVITAPLQVPGGEVLLCDTAGLIAPEYNQTIDSDQITDHDQTIDPDQALASDQAHETFPHIATRATPHTLHEPVDPLSIHMAAATQKAIATADLPLVVVDALDQPHLAIQRLSSCLNNRPYHLVLTKIDALSDTQQEQLRSQLDLPMPSTLISAYSGRGIDELRQLIGRQLFGELETHGAELLALSQRQRTTLIDARNALQRGQLLCREAEDIASHAELIALELRAALHALSLLMGEVTSEDLLGRIFSQFCIGK